MSRTIVVVGCAVALLWNLGVSQEVVSQDQVAKLGSESNQPSELTGEAHIEAVLDRQLRAPLQCQELPLSEILHIIEDDYNIPIVLDLSALDELAISPETEITIDFWNISLRNALKLMLRQPGIEDLSFYVDREVLVVTTEDRAKGFLITKVYRVDDLDVYPPMPKGATAWAAYSPLIGAITSCVESKSWKENGTGKGEIRLVSPGILVISQTPSIHTKIVDLFNEIRALRNEMIVPAGEGNGQASKETRGFRVGDDIAKLPQVQLEELKTSIKESVEWGDQADESVWIRIVGNRILTRHRTEVLNQIHRVLARMGLVAPNIHVGSGGGGSGSAGSGGGFF